MSNKENKQQQQQQPLLHRKIVVVGDGASGKTCALRTFHDNQFPPDNSYIPTVFDTCIMDIPWRDHQIELGLWDTAGQEDYDRLRIMSYENTHIVLMCFSVDSIESLENTNEKWFPEIKEHAPNAKVLLVGLKTDLRDDPETLKHMRVVYRRGPLTGDEGRQMAAYLRVPYVECSAKNNFNVRHVFETAINMVVSESDFNPPKDDGSCCLIL